MNIPQGKTITVAFFTHSAAGASVDADALPTVNCRIDGAAASATGVTVANVTTGEYKADIVCSSGNGFALGSTVEVAAIVVVGGVTSKQNIARFRIVIADVVTGTPAVDLARWRGSIPSILSSGAVVADAVAISGDTGAADNLEATFDGTGFANGNAPATQTALAAISTKLGAPAGASIAADIATRASSSALTSVASDIGRTLGLQRENCLDDNHQYDPITGLLTSCRRRIFASKAATSAAAKGAANGADNEIARYTLTFTFDGDNHCDSFRSVRDLP